MAEGLQRSMLANLDRVLGEPDTVARRRAMEELWDPDCLLVDPQGRHEGYDVINQNFDHLQAQFPGSRFVATSPVQEQSGVARMTWVCRSADGKDIFSGMDVCVERDGRILSLFAFRDGPDWK